AYAVSQNPNVFPDGYIVVGDSWGNGDPGHATMWDVAGPHALPDLGHTSSASTISEDGHVIGGVIDGIGGVVWIGGRLKALVDEQGDPFHGAVTSIVTGLSGYSGAWAAFGVAADGQLFVAFDDGVARPLNEWLGQSNGIQVADESLADGFYHDG